MMTDEEKFNTVKYMIEHAIQHQLETEVIIAFVTDIENGEKDWRKASHHAMHEWDI